MKVITVVMHKGGVGKTTTALNLGLGLYHRGKSVLFIDLDSQANLSFSLDASNRPRGTYELLKGEKIENCITKLDDNLAIVSGASKLMAIQDNIKTDTLYNALKGYKEYDYIIVDTPPTPCKLMYVGIMASNGIIIPVSADILSYNALSSVIQYVSEFKEVNHKIKIYGILVTDFDSRSNLSRDMRDNLIKLANKLKVSYLGSIRHGIAVSEAEFLKEDLFTYAKSSKPTLDYSELAYKIDTEF